MRVRNVCMTALVMAALVCAPAAGQQAATADKQSAPAGQQTGQLRQPDVIFVPTPQEVVDAMLEMAKVTKTDVVYDLGSGDGRIPITAAKKYGARAIGIDIDPQRIKEANENLKQAGVDNVKLMPKLQTELKPGTRIVSHSFDMGDQWPPEKTQDVNGRMIYYWTIGKK